MSEFLTICVLYTLYRMAKGIWCLWSLMFADRTGNSGRYGHWNDEDANRL